MKKLRTSWFFLPGVILMGMSLFVFLTGRASAAIELLYFTASTETDRVRLDWETATELDNAGFNLLRSETGGNNPGVYTPVPVIDATTGAPFTFIPARGDTIVGAVYAFYDENVDIGTRYYYFLQDIDTSNVSAFHGPVEVVAGQTSTPTPTNTAVSTSTPTSTAPPATNTPTIAPSPTATSPSSPGPTSTAVPTSNPTQTQSSSPTSNPASPTASSTPDPQLSDFDMTLTAVFASVTEVATEEATATALTVAQAATDHATPTSTRTQAPPTPEAPIGNPPPLGRIVLLVGVFLASGILLTVGILLFARRDP